jgi:hypothetical protein
MTFGDSAMSSVNNFKAYTIVALLSEGTSETAWEVLHSKLSLFSN